MWTFREAARTVDDPEVREMLEEWDTKVAEFDPKKILKNDSPVTRSGWPIPKNRVGEHIQLPGNTDVPLATQRSDNWDMLEGPISTEGMNDPQAKNAMKEADHKRRLHEARELVEAQK